MADFICNSMHYKYCVSGLQKQSIELTKLCLAQASFRVAARRWFQRKEAHTLEHERMLRIAVIYLFKKRLAVQ